MLQKIILLLILICFSCPVFAAPSATTTKDGLNFEVASTAINTIGATKYLVIEFKFNNQTGSRKIDLDSGFQYALADNFNNRYRPLPKPADYTKQLEQLPKNFPSVYPGESCITTLFFEAPVPNASTLELLVTAPSLGINTPVSVHFSISPFNPTAQTEHSDNQWIEIISPENGSVIEKGTVFPLKIKLKAGQLPNKLIVLAFDHTFEDLSPSEENVYNIATPENTAVGQASISVIGLWNTPPNNQVAAKDIIIYVKGEPPLTQL